MNASVNFSSFPGLAFCYIGFFFLPYTSTKKADHMMLTKLFTKKVNKQTKEKSFFYHIFASG